MNRNIAILIVCFIFGGCARTPSTLQKSQDITFGRAANNEEIEKLPIGRVVAIEQIQAQVTNYDTKKIDNKTLSFGEFLVLPFVPILLFVSDAVALFVPNKLPAADRMLSPKA